MCENDSTNLQKMQQKTQRQTLCDMGNVHVFHITSICIHGENFSDNRHSMKNTEDLTMKQMFDTSEKLKPEQSDEVYGVKTINWEDSSWKYLSLHGDEEVISLLHAKVYLFSDLLCFGKMNENPKSNTAWEQRLEWFKKYPGNLNLRQNRR